MAKEPATKRQKALLAAFDKAQKIKLSLTEKFKDSALPVDALSVVASNDVPDGFGVAVHLLRRPNSDEIKQLPQNVDGVGVLYYARENGQNMKLSWKV